MKFDLVIMSGNEAFTDDPRGEVARILRDVAQKVVAADKSEGPILDVNGNTVGSYELDLG